MTKFAIARVAQESKTVWKSKFESNCITYSTFLCTVEECHYNECLIKKLDGSMDVVRQNHLEMITEQHYDRLLLNSKQLIFGKDDPDISPSYTKQSYYTGVRGTYWGKDY